MNEKVEHPLIFAVLSTELILEILSYLPVKELGALTVVCAVFNQLANDKHLWRQKIKHDAPSLYKELSTQQDVDYKLEYKREQNRKLPESSNPSWFSFNSVSSFFSSVTAIEPEEETAIEIMGFLGI